MNRYQFEDWFTVADFLPTDNLSVHLGKEGEFCLEGQIEFIPCMFRAISHVFTVGGGLRTTMEILHNRLMHTNKLKIIAVRSGRNLQGDITKPPASWVTMPDSIRPFKDRIDFDLDKNQEESNLDLSSAPPWVDLALSDGPFQLVSEELVRESERAWNDEEFSSMLSAYIGRVLALYIDWLEYGHVALLKKETAFLTLLLYLLRRRIDKCEEWKAIMERQLNKLESEVQRAKIRKAGKLLTPKTATKNLDPGDMSE